MRRFPTVFAVIRSWFFRERAVQFDLRDLNDKAWIVFSRTRKSASWNEPKIWEKSGFLRKQDYFLLFPHIYTNISKSPQSRKWRRYSAATCGSREKVSASCDALHLRLFAKKFFLLPLSQNEFWITISDRSRFRVLGRQEICRRFLSNAVQKG